MAAQDSSLDYIKNLLSSINGAGTSGSFNNYEGSPQTITNNGTGTYSFNGTSGWNEGDIGSLLNGTMDAGQVLQHDQAAQSRAAFGVGNPTNRGTGQPLTIGNVINNTAPNTGFASNNEWGKFTPREMGQSQGLGGSFGRFLQKYEPTAIGVGTSLITGGLGAALGGLSGLAGGSTIGAGLGGLVGGATHSLASSGSLPSPLSALGSFAGGAGGNLAGQYFPETMNSINPFSSSPSNVATGDTSGISMNADNVSGPMSVPGGGSSMGSFGGASNVAPNSSFLDNLNPFSSSDNVAGSGFNNMSGNASGSLFDRVGNFVSENPLTTIGGLAAAGSGAAGLLDSGSNTSGSADIGQGLSSFTPSQQSIFGAPQSLSNYTSPGMDSDQTLSGIATKGVYGGGNGPEEQKYFLNLINNRLVDPQGKVGDMASLNPIENSYLSQLGLGGYGNTSDLLKGISNYNY